MPTIHIDGQSYNVKKGDNLLQASLSLGLDLPYFCWHPSMGSIGACRQCAIVQYQNADDQRGRIVMGCMTPVTDGAIFSLGGDKAKTFRASIVESLMLNHPHDCPVCAEGGECHLQDMTVMVGHRDRHYRGLKNTHRNQYLGPLIHHEMNRCITCYRCTRYYRDYAGGTDLAAMAAHDHVYFGRHEDGVLQSEFAGNLIEVCPTGVFTDKPLVHEYTRKWDLQSAPSVCTSCAVGCNTMPGERYGKIKRVHNRFNAEVNGYFLCDRGRFGATFVNHQQRLDYAGLRDDNGHYNAITQQQASQQLANACKENGVAGIGSPRASVEANFLLRKVVGANNFCPGFSSAEQPLIDLALRLQQQTAAAIASISQIEAADAVFILGEDITHSAPRIALALRQSVRNKAYTMASELHLEPWQDAAVRNLAQDQLSPLYIAAVADTRLDDVAVATLRLAPDDIARLGFAVAASITGERYPPLEAALQSQVEAIASTLKQSHRPLIVSGTSCANSAVMIAAESIANALCSPADSSNSGQSAMLCITVPEANSLGQAMLAGAEAPTLQTLTERALAGNIQTLLIMENDLYRRGSEADIERLLKHVPTVITLDSLENRTLDASSLVLPAASFAETEGSLVSLEGRAQRHFPVFVPTAQRRASWAWLLDCLKAMARPDAAQLHHFDDISQACAAEVAALAGITAAAPDHLFLNAGVKIPRQPHRYSGRTAIRADVSVHESKQPVDEESALAFTMEGLNQFQPGALLPYVWSAGWNSNQSLHKFQSEVGGPLKGGTAGASLLRPTTTVGARASSPTLEAFQPVEEQWLLVPRQHIFGSDELSAQSPAIAELIDPARIEISPADAQRLNVNDGDGLQIQHSVTASPPSTIKSPTILATLEVRINNHIVHGCACYSAGFVGTFNLTPGDWVWLQKASQWERRQDPIDTAAVIATDAPENGGGRHV